MTCIKLHFIIPYLDTACFIINFKTRNMHARYVKEN